MTAERHIRNLALIGFMGAGKSSVGQIVATQLHFDFLDTDEVIEQQAGKTVSAIFSQDGEPAFRDWERRIVADLASKSRFVISTGGGLPAVEGNVAQLKTHSLVVCLWASPEKIWGRVHGQTHRPLLNDPDPLGKIRQLLHAREPFYRQADILLNTDMRPVREVAVQVVHHFREATRGHGKREA